MSPAMTPPPRIGIGPFFMGLAIIVVPDDDPRVQGLPPGHVATADWTSLYVRESSWPELLGKLRRFNQQLTHEIETP